MLMLDADYPEDRKKTCLEREILVSFLGNLSSGNNSDEESLFPC
jgi:hypothetical protein